MEIAKFNIWERRFNNGQRISFFLLGSLTLLGILILSTIFLNKKLGISYNISGLSSLVFFVFEYFLAAFVFAYKTKGIIEFDEAVIKIKTSADNLIIGSWDLEKIAMKSCKRKYFATGTKPPRTYTVKFHLKHSNPLKLTIENQVKNRQSFLPAAIHEFSEQFKIPLNR